MATVTLRERIAGARSLHIHTHTEQPAAERSKFDLTRTSTQITLTQQLHNYCNKTELFDKRR